MTICLVTDRARRDPVEQAKAAVDAGIDLIHVRERDLDGAALASILRAAIAVARGSATRVVVNDRIDLAIACGADGVHLRGDSLAAAAARRAVPAGFLVSRSVHSVDDARMAGPVDFLVAGTVFRTPSKDEDAPLLGVEGLATIVRAATVPVLAIGGITIARAAEVAAAGAAGIAAIGLFASGESLSGTVQTLRARFDTAKTAS